MIGAFLAYYYGKNAARREADQEPAVKNTVNADDLAGSKLYGYVIFLCVVALIAASLWT